MARAGILVDEEFGAAILRDATERGYVTALATEKSGTEELVRYNPEDDAAHADSGNCTVTYSRGGRRLAVAVVHRDLEGLRAEVEFEQASRGETQ